MNWPRRPAGPGRFVSRGGTIFGYTSVVANPFTHWIEAKGPYAPWLFLALFIGASFLMIWRLEALSQRGFQGTVLGTLIMPYCSGLGNLIFAFILGHNGGAGADVMINSLVNNITNMTLILGLPAIFWRMSILPARVKPAHPREKGRGEPEEKANELNRLSLLMTLMAVLFFSGAVWAMGRKGQLDFNDGLVLVGLFLFWQCFHVVEVLKHNVREDQSLGWTLPLDLILLGVGAYGIYASTDWLVAWISNIQTGFVSAPNLGWLSGWVMVLPNGVLAIYYAWRRQPETVYASQVGDAHVSIPLCLGIFALYRPLVMPPIFHTAMLVLLGATVIHLFFVVVLGRLPRVAGIGLVAAYGYFIYKGLIK
jgi:cation:H+ antiporter